MNKYSDEELKSMATALKRYKTVSEDSYLQFVLTVSMLTGNSVEYVENKIEEYAVMEVGQ